MGSPLLMFTLIGAGVGGLMLVSAVGSYRGGKAHGKAIDELLRTGTRARASIVGFETYSVGNRPRDPIDSTMYHPIVRFTTPQGVVEAAVRNGAGFPIGEVGEEREICYDPEEPTLVIITDSKLASATNASRMQKVGSVIFALGGLGILAFTAFFTYLFW